MVHGRGKNNSIQCNKDIKGCVSNSKTTDMSEAEIQELYENAKNIIREMPDKIIKVSKFNIYQPDIFGRDELRERVDYVQLFGKNKLVFMSESIVNGQPWVAYLSHLSAELRREVLKQIVKIYGILNSNRYLHVNIDDFNRLKKYLGVKDQNDLLNYRRRFNANIDWRCIDYRVREDLKKTFG